jgi:hypothetical protein
MPRNKNAKLVRIIISAPMIPCSGRIRPPVDTQIHVFSNLMFQLTITSGALIGVPALRRRKLSPPHE